MHRVEVCLKRHLPDARGLGLVRDIHDLGITSVSNVRVVDIYWLDADLTPDTLDLVCRRLLADPVTQEYQCFTPSTDIKGSLKGPRPFKNNHSPSPFQGEGDKGGEVNKQWHTVEVAYNTGVTDPVEGTIIKALKDLGVAEVRAVKTAKRYLIEGRLDKPQLDTISRKLLVNPIIQHVVQQEPVGFPENPQYKFALKEADVRQAGQQFGFTEDELQAILAYFEKQGRNPTDAELETSPFLSIMLE